MKKILLALAIAGLLGKANAQSSGFGLGIMVGDPTGISGKYWLSGDRAADFGLAWSLNGDYFHVHADYLFHNTSLISVSKGQLALYYGPGVRIRTWSKGKWEDHDGSQVSFGARFPVGLDYMFDGAPVDCFLELAPSLDLVPSTTFDLDAAIGARYWF